MKGAKHINWKDLLQKPEYRGGIMWTNNPETDTQEKPEAPVKSSLENDPLEMTLKKLIAQEVKRLGK